MAGGYSPVEEMQDVRAFTSTQIAASEDMFNGDPASDVISLSQHRGIVFTITKYAGATGTADITVESCDDVTPTTTTAVAFRYRATTGATPGAWTAAAAAGFTTTAGANQSYEIVVLAEGLSGTDQFVRLQCTENADSPCDGAISAKLFGPRFAFDGGIDPTA